MAEFEPVTIQSVSAAIFSYRRWREKFLHLILNVACVVGLVAAVLASLDIMTHGGRVELVVVYMAAWLLSLVLTLMKRSSYKLRAGFFLLLLYTLAVSGLLENGMRGDGRLFLFGFIVLTALMINPHAGILALVLSLLTIGSVAWLVSTGQFQLLSKSTPPGDVWLWVVGTISFLTLVAAVLIGLTLFLREFDAAQRRVLDMLENDRKLTARLQQELAVRQQAQAKILEMNEELEQRVLERTAQLEQANKDLESFSYSVSHDLRAPLRAINGFTSIIKADYADHLDEMGVSFLDKTIASVERLNQLIEALLRFSRLNRKELTKRVVRTSEIVNNVVEALQLEIANRQIKWILPELPTTQADSILLEQVFANLIGNAVKYTGRHERAQIEVGSFFKDGEKGFFVRDDGSGFDMKHASNLFGVFQRLHREEEFEGSGIGLATVKRIIDRHGGRVWAEAQPEKGATFYFTLGR